VRKTLIYGAFWIYTGIEVRHSALNRELKDKRLPGDFLDANLVTIDSSHYTV
jgi:hypothetical protein